ncbi:vacuolar fusion protein CCZ1 homolog B-like isoform X2 [Silene latifolia]|uniref:vacuolar fusion protein CCZ1 homolog B-like isoform X2 n=1 Tax=Silene latifolia TaxID=37657 RepID=UPI003D784070
MGLYSANSSSIPADSVKLCVFDLRRGQKEGEEIEKILFFYPPDLAFTQQLSVIGLSEGLITFTRIFSPDAACEVIEADRHSHVFYEAEPDIWMVMVVEKNKGLEAIWRIDALRSMLKEVHSLFIMFNGSIRVMLDEESSGALLRPLLYSFITDYLFDMFSGKKLQLPSFRDSLKERGTVQMLTVGREAAIEIQSLMRLLESSAGSARCHSVILFHDLLVSTSLCPDDTVNLYTYAVMRMSPQALSSKTSSWSYLRKGSTVPHYTTGSVFQNSSSADQVHGSRDTSPSRDDNRLINRPLQLDNWSKGKDGFLLAKSWGSDSDTHAPNSVIPAIWLQGSKERMYLCAHQHKNITIILLIPVTSINNAEREIPTIKHQLLEKASLKILKIEEKLSKGWGGENAYHVKGYRYLLVDGDRNVSRASPASKAATLAKESFVAMCKLREEIDHEKSRARQEEVSKEKELEVCIRAKNNAWVVARITKGKELYVVLEKANDTLLYASDAIEKFSNRYCNGTFSLD